jgi:hypothetical protein
VADDTRGTDSRGPQSRRGRAGAAAPARERHEGGTGACRPCADPAGTSSLSHGHRRASQSPLASGTRGLAVERDVSPDQSDVGRRRRSPRGGMVARAASAAAAPQDGAGHGLGVRGRSAVELTEPSGPRVFATTSRLPGRCCERPTPERPGVCSSRSGPRARRARMPGLRSSPQSAPSARFPAAVREANARMPAATARISTPAVESSAKPALRSS